MIEELIAKHPHEHKGRQWAAADQPALADHFRVKTRTIGRWVILLGLVSDCKLMNRRKQYLLRTGEPDPVDPDKVTAKAMSAIWRKKFPGRIVDGHEFGCLIGLAQVLPARHQIAIFSYAVKDWTAAAFAIQLAVDALPIEEQIERFYTFPSISVMRRFPGALLEAWRTNSQEEHPQKAYEQKLHKRRIRPVPPAMAKMSK